MIDEFLAHAKEAFPNEACGVVVKAGKRKTRVIRCRNISDTPSEAFEIDPDDYSAAEEAGEIVGIYHSHPNTSAEPSLADLSMCEVTGVPWHIVSWPQAGYRYVEPSGYQAPLEGRPFVYGVHDCFTLVRDYYARTLGLALPDFDHGRHGWWNRGGNLYMDNLEAAGFVVVSDLKPHDALLMQFDAQVPHHAAIYLGDNTILQHMDGRLSGKTFYGEYYQKVTRLVVRHKSLC